MKKGFTKYAREVMNAAAEAAAELGHSYIGTEHLLIGLAEVDSSISQKILGSHGVTSEGIKSLISKAFSGVGNTMVSEAGGLTPRAQKLIDEAGRESERFGSNEVGTEHLLIALLKQEDSSASRILQGMGANRQKIFNEILVTMGEDPRKFKEEVAPSKNTKKAPKDDGILKEFSTDICEEVRAGKLDPVIGRGDEIARIVQILSRRTKNNPCLVGEPGVGKTAIVEALAEKIVGGEIAGPIADKRVLSLDLPAMVAGTKFRGEFEERIKNVIREVREAGDIILFMDEIHTMIGAGGSEGSIDAANILKPALARGDIQIIGATTMDEYRKYFEKDAALERRFQPVYVEQPTGAETVEILKGLRSRYEEHHGVEITDAAVESAVNLSTRYINDRFLPDKAIDLIDEASSRVKLDSYMVAPALAAKRKELEEMEERLVSLVKKGDMAAAHDLKVNIELLKSKMQENSRRSKKKAESRPLVTENDVADVVAKWTKIPVKKLAEEEGAKLRSLEKTLHKRVVAQDEAVVAVSKAIRRGRVGLKDPNKPIGSFLFLGPTGVGKTELSKALAEALFGTEESIIRVDMSEYMEKHSVSKLIGSPPGYVGYDEGGQLSEQVRRHPYSIILFDEIEKAHPDVFNILLQVLDDGRITDSHGRVCDFKNTIIIMTSNAGAMRIMEPKNLGFATSADTGKQDYEKMKTAVMDEVKQTFKPEFINRIDEIIVFAALTKGDMKSIIDIIFKGIAGRAKSQMNIELTITDKAKEYLVNEGYDARYGARALKRKVQAAVEDVMAEEILAGKIKAGDRVSVISGKTGIAFKVKK